MRRMVTAEDLKLQINGSEISINDGLTVNSNGDVEVGRNLTVDGAINGIPQPPTAAGSYKLVVSATGVITWELIA